MSESQLRTGTAHVGDIDIYYEDIGDIAHPPVLLIMGLSAQLTVWPTGFCDVLVDQGYRVIRFDNRDIGLSTHLDGVRVSGSILPRLIKTELGLGSDVPYTVVDMAADAIGVLDYLGIERAHVVGASMGGMIAQVVGGKYPERVSSLAILFSSTLQALLPPPDPRKLLALLSGPGKGATREDYIAGSAKALQTIGSPGYPLSDDEAWELAASYHDRSHDPAGILRQTSAVMGSGSLRRYARKVTAPAVVIHGKADGLMRPSGGKAIAHAISGSKLVLIDGMGHDLPEPLWPQITGELMANFARATTSADAP
ncbi:alpha/beta fold hydrolase [Williamsia phyllosphaerae]|uniref:Lipase/esterase LipG n=1 Tax=Williamsia phyllosphaerae TaxID=885042 RepID=A0ABQ1V0P5_9NOCA|nr:alpha/beta hydrolase [Williamsia phyllosphaerae]GGF33403.1 putative lipase/esterase LipG [Williamsia phyllosphaerae]